MPRPLRAYTDGGIYPSTALPALPLVLWTPENITRKFDQLGRPLTVSGVTKKIVGQSGKFGAGPGFLSNGTNGTVSGVTNIQAPGVWSSFVIFEPPSSGGFFLYGWKNAPGSTTYDRATYIKSDRTVEAYLFDGAGKSVATANTVRGGINVAIARCDGAKLYVRLNDGAETSVLVSNGGYTGYNTATCVTEALLGPITAGGASNTAAAGALVAAGFYRRFLSQGEVSGLCANPWAIGMERPSMRAASSILQASARRRQLVNC